jgi:hypothetical protein
VPPTGSGIASLKEARRPGLAITARSPIREISLYRVR